MNNPKPVEILDEAQEIEHLADLFGVALHEIDEECFIIKQEKQS